MWWEANTLRDLRDSITGDWHDRSTANSAFQVGLNLATAIPFGTATRAFVGATETAVPTSLASAGRFRGQPLAFGTGARSERVNALVGEAAKASGVSDIYSLVDDVVMTLLGHISPWRMAGVFSPSVIRRLGEAKLVN